jgi:PEP-CTERM motif
MAGFVISLAPTAKADIIYTNLAPGETPGTVCCGNPPGSMGGFGIPSTEALAAEFVPQSTFIFTDAELPLAVNLGTATANVYLMAGAAGLPGTILEQFSVTGLPPTESGTIFVVDSVLQPVLQAGTAYWLAVSPADPSSNVSWRRDSTGDFPSGTNFASNFSFPTGSWNLIPVTSASTDRPAFQIDGTPVPEPSSSLLLGAGLLGLMAITWRRKRFA